MTKEKFNELVDIQNDDQFYLVLIKTDSDGNSKMQRLNVGFSGMELLGLVERTKYEILQQITGAMSEPEVISRQVEKPLVRNKASQ